MPLDAKGNADEGYTLPSNIVQDEWTLLYLTSDEANRLLCADGKLYGIQIAAPMLDNGVNTFYKGEKVANILIDYIAVCSLKTLTYHNLYGGGENRSVLVQSQFDLEGNYYYPPERNGWLFGGWYEGEDITVFNEPHDFSLSVTDDIHLTARWIKLHSNLSEYIGVYKNGSGKSFMITENGINLSGLVEYYDGAGIGNDGILYIVQSDGIVEIPLDGTGDFEAKDYFTISYYCFDEIIYTGIFAEEDDSAEFIPSMPNGFNFLKWTTAQNPSSSSPEFVFGNKLSANINLYAYCTYQSISDEAYPAYYGVYYRVETGERVVLGGLNSAVFVSADNNERNLTYFVLEDNGFACISGGVLKPGTIEPLRLVFDGAEYKRLTPFTVLFEKGYFDEEPSEVVTVDGGENGDNFTVATPDAPERAGYKFLGWYTDVRDGSLFDFNSIIYDNITVYAHWEALPPQGNPSDPGDGSDDKELPGWAIAVIVTGSVAVAAGGGFALWYFVIRKKRIGGNV